MSPDPTDQLARALDSTGAVIDAIGAAQWELPTPCSEWNVAAVVGHLTAGNAGLASALRGKVSEAAPPSHAGPASAYRKSAASLLDAFRQPGALERPVTIPFGTIPGGVAANLRITEALVHGWDLAQAIQQSTTLFPDDLAEAALAFSKASLGAIPAGRRPFRDPQPVADDAPAIDRLAALLGRQVHPNEGAAS